MEKIIKQLINTKQFHICMISIIVIAILFVVGVITLKYNVEGETNLPFNLSQISIISSVEGTDTEDTENKWNLKVDQNNDIYLYIKKNDNYKDEEIIKSIKLDNFIIKQSPKIGELKLYKPDNQFDNVIFKNTTENQIENIEFLGSMESNIKELKISNQGGLVIFRYSITDIGKYVTDDDEIKHSELLNKLDINNDDLKFKISFDMYINLVSKKSYKTNIELELPINDVVNDGVQSIEYTDLDNIVFKRI